MINVLGIFKSPTPYFTNLFTEFSNIDNINFRVAFCARTTDGDNYYDGVSKTWKKWGVNVLNGYDYFFLNDKIVPVGISDFKIINKSIFNYIKKNDIDVIIMGNGYWSLTTWFSIMEAQIKRIPIITRATVETERKRNRFLLLLKRIIVGTYCRRMSAGLFECQAQKKYLQLYGMSENSLFYSPCAVDNKFFQKILNNTSKDDIRRELNIDHHAIVVTTTGQIIPRKRPWDLIHATEMLLNDGIIIELYIVGDGSLKDDIQKYVIDKNLKNIHLTGKVTQKDIAKYLRASDIYVLASENDASPKALNEAMNFKLPIIVTTGISTAHELLKPGINGYIFEPGDINMLACHIKELVNDNHREIKGEKSFEIVSENGFERVIRGWLDAIKFSLNTNI